MRPHLLDWIHRRKHPEIHGLGRERLVQNLDRLLLFVAIIAPFTNIPQFYNIVAERSAGGVSLVTWVLYSIITIPWLAYGILHREKPILVSSVLWLVSDLAVIAALLFYS